MLIIALIFCLFVIYAIVASKVVWKTPKHDVLWPYVTPGIFYPFKVVIFYLILTARKRSEQKKRSEKNASCEISKMERPQPLSQNVKAINAVFFSGYGKDGWSVVMAMGRRPKRIASVVAYIKSPNGDLYAPRRHPDSMHFRDENDEDAFKAGGLSISPLEPMKKWHISFQGALRKLGDDDGESVKANVDVIWSSSWGFYDYEKDADAWTMAKIFGAENWSKQYFENLKNHHQCHYEQMGSMEGKISLGDTVNEVKMPSFRDHSFGNREWKLMHRYAFHHIFLDDGSKGVVGVVCQPSTCSRLIAGHWWTKDGIGSAVTHTDFELLYHGERGTPPRDYAFTFLAGGTERLVKVCIEKDTHHYLDWDWEAKLFERWVSYEVDGIKGRGICEFQYRHKEGRPSKYSEMDPQWTKELREEYLLT